MENICKKYWELIHHIGKILAEEDQVHFENFIEEVKKMEAEKQMIDKTD